MEAQIKHNMLHLLGKWLIEFLSDRGTLLSALVLFVNMVIQNVTMYLAPVLMWLRIEDAQMWLKFGASGFAFLSAVILFIYHCVRLHREYYKEQE